MRRQENHNVLGRWAGLEVTDGSHHRVIAFDLASEGGVNGGESSRGVELVAREVFGVCPGTKQGKAPLVEGARVKVASDGVEELARRETMGQEMLRVAGGVHSLHA